MMEFDGQDGKGETTEFYDQVLTHARDFGARIVVLDSLHDLFVGNENSRPQARQFINALRRIAIEIDGAVLLTAHPSLSGRATGTGEAGSTAWNNTVRSRLYLTDPSVKDDEAPDPNRRILATKKANYGPRGTDIDLEWRNGVFVPIEQAGDALTSIELSLVDKAFLTCLDALAARKTKVSEKPQSGNYAPKVMARMPERGKHGGRALTKAMHRLFAAGQIVNQEFGPPSRPYTYIVRAKVEELVP
jgi:RecA-family ATPase